MIRLFNHYLSVRLVLLTFLEASVLFGAIYSLMKTNVTWLPVPPVGEGVTFTALMLTSMSAMGLYQQDHAEPFRVTLQRLVIAYGITLVLLAALFTLLPGFYKSRSGFMLASLGAVAGVVALRVLFFHLTDWALPKRRILVVGNGGEAQKVVTYLTRSGAARGVQYCGLYAVEREAELIARGRPPNHERLTLLAKEMRVGEIVIAVKERRGGVLPLRQLLDCKLHGVRVLDLPSFYERELGQVQLDSLKASWLIFGEGFDQGLWRDVVKRMFDVFASLGLVVLMSPVLLLAALAVFIETGRPIFYRQERVGAGGETFHVLKLRTMVQNAEKDGKAVWATINDARITRVGAFLRKTRIDEIPQILNVLRGEMSFVGPRPERPQFVADLIGQIPYYDVRHSLKPGITGWAQVRYEYGSSIEDAVEKLQYDLYYVKNHSLFLDLLILVETVQVVLSGKGAR